MYKDGSRFEATWKDDKIDGIGLKIYADGTQES